jgi:excisionase family DNA binding protein
MGTLEPIGLSPRDAAAFLGISKRTMSRLISSRKITARKAGLRTLVDVASLKAYYESLPLKTDHAPLVFVHPITGRRHRPRKGCHWQQKEARHGAA